MSEMKSLEERFEELEAKDDDREYGKFDNVKEKFSNRPDLHAFILLDMLVPGTEDMISAAEHDIYYLSVDPEKLNEVITDEQIVDLRRCGVMWDNDGDGLALFA